MKINVYQSETDSYIEMELIGKVKYIGESFGVDELTNNKVYNVVGIEQDMFRIVDNSGEDYLYSTRPGAFDDYKKCGKWEIVEDNEEKTLKKTIEKYS